MKKTLLLANIAILFGGLIFLLNSCGDDIVNTTGQVAGGSTVDTGSTTSETSDSTGDDNDDTDAEDSIDVSKFRTYKLPMDYNNDTCYLEKKDDISFLTCSVLLFTSIKTGTNWTSGKEVVEQELNGSFVNMVNIDIYGFSKKKYSTYDSFIIDFHALGDDVRYVKGPYGTYEYLKDFLYSQILDYHNFLNGEAI